MFVGCVFRDLRSAHLFTWRMLMMCGRGAVRSARTTPNIASSKTALPIVSAYFWPVSLIQFFKKLFLPPGREPKGFSPARETSGACGRVACRYSPRRKLPNGQLSIWGA